MLRCNRRLQKRIKSFVGLASYFRSHIAHFAELVQPFQEYLEGYNQKQGKQPVLWTEVLQQTFDRVQDAIVHCTKLLYRDDNAPIRVYTDASNYGIGAYICQIVKGEEIPIEFISKSLAKGN